MVVAVDLQRSVIDLQERDDFGTLKLVVTGHEDLADVLDTLGDSARHGDEDHVWIGAAAIERWAQPTSPEWVSKYHAMLEKVRPYGWYDEETHEVRLHVEWA